MIEPKITAEAIARRVAEMGAAISRDHEGKDVHLLGILRGCFVFLADLARHVTVPTTIDFIALGSYGGGTKSSGIVKLEIDLGISIEGRHVVVVEDIVDTGLTLDYLSRNLATRRPASLRICTLLSKPSRRKIEIPVDYVGFEIPDEFVVGYGLDHDQRHRNLPYIGVVKQPPTV